MNKQSCKSCLYYKSIDSSIGNCDYPTPDLPDSINFDVVRMRPDQGRACYTYTFCKDESRLEDSGE